MNPNISLTRCLVVLLATCAVAASAARAQEGRRETPQQIFQSALQAHQQKDYPKFLEQCKKLNEMFPAEPMHMYNMACGYALTGEKDAALEWLEKSLKAGFGGTQENVDLLKTDPDFASIRGDERFAKLLQTVDKGEPEKPKFSLKDVRFEVFTPPGLEADKKHATIVALHGYGAGPEKALNNWKEAAEKSSVLLLAVQGPEEMSESTYHWGELDDSVAVVVAAVEKAVKELPVDRERVVLTGFSQGGSLSYEVARKHPELVCGVIPVAARYMATEEPAGSRIAKSPETKLAKVFIMVGAKDRSTLVDSNKQAAEDFEAAGCKVELNTYEGVRHKYPKNRLEEQVKAIKFVLE